MNQPTFISNYRYSSTNKKESVLNLRKENKKSLSKASGDILLENESTNSDKDLEYRRNLLATNSSNETYDDMGYNEDSRYNYSIDDKDCALHLSMEKKKSSTEASGDGAIKNESASSDYDLEYKRNFLATNCSNETYDDMGYNVVSSNTPEKAEGVYQEPCDTSEVYSKSSYGNNVYFVSSDDFHDGVDIDTLDIMRSALKNLNIEVYFPVPKLHEICDRASELTPQQRLKVAEENLTIKSGKFLKAEDELIKENWRKFIQAEKKYCSSITPKCSHVYFDNNDLKLIKSLLPCKDHGYELFLPGKERTRRLSNIFGRQKQITVYKTVFDMKKWHFLEPFLRPAMFIRTGQLRNVHDMYNFEDVPELFFSLDRKYISVKEKHNFLVLLSHGLNERTPTSVYRRFKLLMLQRKRGRNSSIGDKDCSLHLSKEKNKKKSSTEASGDKVIENKSTSPDDLEFKQIFLATNFSNETHNDMGYNENVSSSIGDKENALLGKEKDKSLTEASGDIAIKNECVSSDYDLEYKRNFLAINSSNETYDDMEYYVDVSSNTPEKAEGVYQGPCDTSEVYSKSSYGNNAYFVSSDDFDDGVDIDKLDVMRSALKGLNIEVDFPIPKLHEICVRSSKLTPQQKLKVAEENLTIKSGKFLEAEDEIIKENWRKFIQMYNFEDVPELFYSLDKKYISVKEKQSFLVLLAQSLNERTPHSVYRRFKLLMLQKKRGRYSSNSKKDSVLKEKENSLNEVSPDSLIENELTSSDKDLESTRNLLATNSLNETYDDMGYIEDSRYSSVGNKESPLYLTKEENKSSNEVSGDNVIKTESISSDNDLEFKRNFVATNSSIETYDGMEYNEEVSRHSSIGDKESALHVKKEKRKSSSEASDDNLIKNESISSDNDLEFTGNFVATNSSIETYDDVGYNEEDVSSNTPEKAEGVYQEPCDTSEVYSKSSYGNNACFVSSDDFHDGVDIDTLDIMRSALKGLNIEVDFPVPKLHEICVRSSKLTPQQRLKVAEENLTIKSGKFLEAEDEIIKENWRKFIQMYNFEDVPELFFSLDRKYMSVKEKQSFLVFLAQGLNERTPHSVYRRFKLLMLQRKRERYSPTDKKESVLILRKENKKSLSKASGDILLENESTNSDKDLEYSRNLFANNSSNETYDDMGYIEDSRYSSVGDNESVLLLSKEMEISSTEASGDKKIKNESISSDNDFGNFVATNSSIETYDSMGYNEDRYSSIGDKESPLHLTNEKNKYSNEALGDNVIKTESISSEYDLEFKGYFVATNSSIETYDSMDNEDSYSSIGDKESALLLKKEKKKSSSEASGDNVIKNESIGSDNDLEFKRNSVATDSSIETFDDKEYNVEVSSYSSIGDKENALLLSKEMEISSTDRAIKNESVSSDNDLEFKRNFVATNSSIETYDDKEYNVEVSSNTPEKAEDIYQEPCVTSDGNNAYFVSSDDSDDGVDIDKLDVMRSALKSLSIEVYFSIPKLHEICDRASKLTPQQRLKVAEENLTIKSGLFLKAEDEIIKENWRKFIQMYNFEDVPELFYSLDKKYISLKEKQNFLYFLAQGLSERTPFSVYRRFKLLMLQKKRGRFTEEEDKYIMGKMEETGCCRNYVVEIAGHLQRSCHSIEKRIKKLKDKHTRKIQWKKGNLAVFIKYLLKVTGTDPGAIEQLKNRHISSKEWLRLSKKLDGVPCRILQRAWLVQIHPMLFIPQSCCDLRKVKLKLINMFHENKEHDWRGVKWANYVSHFEGLTTLRLYSLLKTLIQSKVPVEKQKNLKGCIKELKKLTLEDLRPHFVNKIKYKDGLVKQPVKKGNKRRKIDVI